MIVQKNVRKTIYFLGKTWGVTLKTQEKRVIISASSMKGW